MMDEPAQLTDAEQQVLIAAAVLVERGQALDHHSLQVFAPDYFGMYRVDWSGAVEDLVARRLLQPSDVGYRLSVDGEALAASLRKENPRHLYFYNEFFTRAVTSRAHAHFCERVYGRNLCQHGMLDMPQLEKLIEILALKPSSRVLELGCGNGMIAELISDTTSAHITGIDSSSVGIQQAASRTRCKVDRLAFIQGDMCKAVLPGSTFDTIIAIDAVYFASDLEALINRMRQLLVPGGQMGIFYSVWIGAEDPIELLQADRTRLSEVLNRLGLSYRVMDFSTEEREHWRRKYQVVCDLKPEFEAEGNAFLYCNRFTEAEGHQQYVNSGRLSRYLYLV
jgi:ubiquinone/menaquinone biosynthesis C-methylase UbiE